MADVNIKGKISLDTGNTAATIKELKTDIAALKKEVDSAKIGSHEYAVASDKLKNAQSQLSSVTKEKTANFAQLKEALKGTVPAFDGASSGATSLGRQLLALMANPIVLLIAAIVGGLALLYKAFTNTIPGAQKMEQIFTGMKAALTVVTDRLVSFGNAIIKIFSGDFKGAAEAAKQAFAGIGTEIADKFDQGQKLQKQLQDIHAEERNNAKDQDARKARLAVIKESLNDENIPFAEKKRLAKELKEEQAKDAKIDLDMQKRKTAAEIAIIKMKKNLTVEDLDEISKKEREISNTQRESAQEGIRINKTVRALDKQERTKGIEDKKKEAEAEKQRLENIREYTNKIKKLQQEQDLAIIKDAFLKEKQTLQNQYQESIRDIELSYEQKKLTRKQANDLIREETKLNNLKLLEIQSKHDEEVRKKDLEVVAVKKAMLERGQSNVKSIEDEGLKIQIKNRTDFIKGLDSELKLKQAQKIATIQIERETYDLKRQLERQTLIDQKASALELKAFDDETATSKIKSSNDERDIKIQNLQMIGSALGQLGQIAGEQTAIGKGLALTQIGIDTGVAISSLTRNSEANPANAVTFGTAGIAQFLSGFARIVANIAKAKSILSSGSVATGLSPAQVPSFSVQAPLQPQSTNTNLSQKSIQAVGDAAHGGVNRTFILDADIRNNSERAARITRAARLG